MNRDTIWFVLAIWLSLSAAGRAEEPIFKAPPRDVYCKYDDDPVLLGYVAINRMRAVDVALDCLLGRWVSENTQATERKGIAVALMGIMYLDPVRTLKAFGKYPNHIDAWIDILPGAAFEWGATEGPCPHKAFVRRLALVVSTANVSGSALAAKQKLSRALRKMDCHIIN